MTRVCAHKFPTGRGRRDCVLCGACPPVLKCCPGCGAPTEPHTVVDGSGASAQPHTHDSWCTPCLRGFIHDAREDGDCHCSDPTHTHNQPLATAVELPL